MATTDDTTMEITTPDGKTTGPVPLSALERASGQLSLFEGRAYPDVDLRLTGGVAGPTDLLLPDISALRIGDEFSLVVFGAVVAKKHGIKYDKDGGETRTLAITLKVDNMRAAGSE